MNAAIIVCLLALVVNQSVLGYLFSYTDVQALGGHLVFLMMATAPLLAYALGRLRGS